MRQKYRKRRKEADGEGGVRVSHLHLIDIFFLYLKMWLWVCRTAKRQWNRLLRTMNGNLILRENESFNFLFFVSNLSWWSYNDWAYNFHFKIQRIFCCIGLQIAIYDIVIQRMELFDVFQPPLLQRLPIICAKKVEISKGILSIYNNSKQISLRSESFSLLLLKNPLHAMSNHHSHTYNMFWWN